MGDKIEIITTIVPKNNGSFPVAYAANIQMSDETSVEDAINSKQGNMTPISTETIKNAFK